MTARIPSLSGVWLVAGAICPSSRALTPKKRREQAVCLTNSHLPPLLTSFWLVVCTQASRKNRANFPNIPQRSNENILSVSLHFPPNSSSDYICPRVWLVPGTHASRKNRTCGGNDLTPPGKFCRFLCNSRPISTRPTGWPLLWLVPGTCAWRHLLFPLKHLEHAVGFHHILDQ